MSFVILAIARGASASRAASVMPSGAPARRRPAPERPEPAQRRGRARLRAPRRRHGEEAPAHHAALSLVVTVPPAAAPRRGAPPGRRRDSAAGSPVDGRPLPPGDAVKGVAGTHDDGGSSRPGCVAAGRAACRREGPTETRGRTSSRGGTRPARRCARPSADGRSPPRLRPRGAREAGRLGAAPARHPRPAVAERVDHRARGIYERARRTARERTRDIGGLRALRTDAGEQDDRPRHRAPRVTDRTGNRCADDRADAREAARADEIRPQVSTSSATCLQTGRPSERVASCSSAAPAFEVRTRRNSPAPSRRHAARNGSIESRPRYGLTVSASASGGSPYAARGTRSRRRERSSRCRSASRPRSRATQPHARTPRPSRARASRRCRALRRTPPAASRRDVGATASTIP